MALIDISDLCFSHAGGNILFNSIRLQLDTTWKLGLIGRNGRGKTTFLKLLLGDYQYSGRISAPVVFDYFPFTVHSSSANAYDLAERLCPGLEQWRLEREASLLEFSPETLSRPVKTLSAGEATKLLLCILFLRSNNFLLIDEPTNHLDANARKTLGRYLNKKNGFILVSHDRSLLDSCIDHVLSINKTNIEVQRGNYSSWQNNQLRQEQYELAKNRKLQKEVLRLGQAARRSAAWSERTESGKYGNGPVDRGFIGRKAAKIMKKAKSAETRRRRALDEKSALLKNIENEAPLSLLAAPFQGKRLAEVSGLKVEYDGKAVVRKVSFSVLSGERLVLQGGNGSGKSTVLKLLTGHTLPFMGEVRLPGTLRISYVPQDTSLLCGRLKNFARDNGIDENRYRAILHRLGFECAQFNVDMADFSAGQKKKALLARSLCQEAHLYVWDEPLNYVDVISRIQLENMILAQQPSMILVEHDGMFAERVGTTFLNLDGE